MVIFPIAAVVLAVVFVVRRKKGGLKLMWVPGLLLLISLAAWNLDSLFVNGPGYYFHHDPGSKVYNEGYIIPHYEDMYGESLELVEKEVIDSCNAVYTLKSGLTGDTFTAESRYYDTCSGSFDMLHLTENYGEILGKRLAGGETVSLPFDEGYSVKMPDGKYAWFMIFKSRDGYRFTIDGREKAPGRSVRSTRFWRPFFSGYGSRGAGFEGGADGRKRGGALDFQKLKSAARLLSHPRNRFPDHVFHLHPQHLTAAAGSYRG